MPSRSATLALLLVGAAALGWSAWIHLHLWASGYRTFPTVGPLFLMQGIAGIVIGAAIAVVRHTVVSLLGALFLVATAFGLLLSHWIGMFGFHERLGAPWAGPEDEVELAAAPA